MTSLLIIKIIDLMPKKFKKTPKPCQSHLFSLKPDPNQDKSPRPINLTLSFCSRNAEGEREAQEQVQCIEAPIYNDDRSFASPAFILPCDKSYYQQRRNKMLDQHQLRFTYYTDEKTELNVPKPKSKNCYCSVCRQYYEDYLEHIQSSVHKSRIAASPFSKHIDELTRTFNNHRSLKNLCYQQKISLEKSIIIEELLDDSDQVEIISNPYKKIKTNQTITIKEQNTYSTLVSKVQQPEQPYYPFNTWSNFIQQQTYPNPSAYPLNFNYNFVINPFTFGQNLPLIPQIPSIGFQPFCLTGANFNVIGVGQM